MVKTAAYSKSLSSFRGKGFFVPRAERKPDIRSMKNLLLLILSLALLGCDPDKSSSSTAATDAPTAATPPEAPAGEVGTPEEPELLSADFNGDGQPDFLELRTTDREDRGLGLERDLIVYSGQGSDRKNWYTARSVILPTENGGMMGDPLEDIAIEGNVIVIKHFGGSRQKWSYTHRFRWQQGDFRLIGVTVHAGAPCDYFEDLDYNLSTGNAEWVKTTEDCSASEDNPVVAETVHNFKLKPAELPVMNGFLTGEHALEIPKVGESGYY